MGKILFEYNNSNKEYAIESAWAEKIGDNYRLDNILFYAPNYSWGDIVEVEDRNGELYVSGLVKESGHTTIRIIFYDIKEKSSTVARLKEMGCDYEGSNISLLISVDVPPEVEYNIIKCFLDEGEKNEIWSYQESCLAHSLNNKR